MINEFEEKDNNKCFDGRHHNETIGNIKHYIAGALLIFSVLCFVIFLAIFLLKLGFPCNTTATSVEFKNPNMFYVELTYDWFGESAVGHYTLREGFYDIPKDFAVGDNLVIYRRLFNYYGQEVINSEKSNLDYFISILFTGLCSIGFGVLGIILFIKARKESKK